MRDDEHKELLRQVRLPLIEALKPTAECKDCAVKMELHWFMDGMRRMSIEATIEPCLKHTLALADGLAAAEKVISR